MDGTWFQSFEGNFHFVYCVVVLVDSLLFTLTVTTALERFTATFSHSFPRPAFCLTQGRWVCWNISQLSHGQDGICALAWKAGPWIFRQKSPISLESCLTLMYALYLTPITSPSPLSWEHFIDETVKCSLMKASQNRHQKWWLTCKQAQMCITVWKGKKKKIFKRKPWCFLSSLICIQLWWNVPPHSGEQRGREAERQRTGGQGSVGVCAWIDPESRTTKENAAWCGGPSCVWPSPKCLPWGGERRQWRKRVEKKKGEKKKSTAGNPEVRGLWKAPCQRTSNGKRFGYARMLMPMPMLPCIRTALSIPRRRCCLMSGDAAAACAALAIRQL